MMVLRSGIDLVDVKRLTDLNPAIRQRFLRRVYTARELQACRNSDQSLAGRFAAKEAVAKALGVGIGPVAWQEIEIVAADSGEPMLQLHGAAQAAAERQGLHTWSLSISHTRTQAIAMAVALGGPSDARDHEYTGSQ
jgi:holo-[acyl-carrier protein] synthase